MHEGFQTFSEIRPKIPSLPKAVDNYIDIWKKYNVDNAFVITGFDRRHPSINLYFGILRKYRSLEYTRSLVHELGFPVRSLTARLFFLFFALKNDFLQATDEDLKYWEEFDVISCTFLWSSDKIDRICFYRQLNQSPTGMDPFFDSIVAKGLPSRRDAPYYSFGHSFTHKGPYLKFEWDYHRTVHDLEIEVYHDNLHVFYMKRFATAKESIQKAKETLACPEPAATKEADDAVNQAREAIDKALAALANAEAKFEEAKKDSIKAAIEAGLM